jgi:ParB family chromosome partitioning protein
VRAVEEAVRDRNGDAAPARRAASGSRESKLRPPGLLELEELLGDYLETRVHVTMGPKLGRVTIDFATLEDLERIYRVMTEGSRSREHA